MKKPLLLLLFVLLLTNFAHAENIAYIVKSSANPAVLNMLEELGYNYTIVTDAQIPSTNFSNYDMLLVWNERLTNYAKVPVTQKKSLVANYYHVNNWKIASYAGRSGWSGYYYGKVFTNNSITQNISSPVKLFNTPEITAYKLPNLPNRAKGITNVLSTNDANSYSIIGTISPGGILYPSGTASARTLFFGITDIDFWTPESKQLFNNSLLWVLKGEDKDGDGFYYDTDCNDNNALINPNATEIAYNYIDENCDGKDLADVDGDGYCKQGYLIQSRFSQCVNEIGNWGADCNDNNSSVSPGSSDLAKNCRNDAPIFTGNIENISFNEDETLSNAVDLNDYFSDPDGDTLGFSVYNKTSSLIVNIAGGIASVSSASDWNGNGFIIFRATDSGMLYNISNIVGVQVNAVNDAPTLQDIADITVIEGKEARIILNAEDIDSANLTYSINDSRFSVNGNVFIWNTVLGDAGTYNFLVSVSDGYKIASKIVSIEVLSKLAINELVSHPSSGNEWVEIYNPGTSSFDLTGCYLEDLAYNHIQLSGSVAGNSFLVKEMSNILNNDGDIVKLFCGGKMLDNVTYGSISSGKSYGRVSDGVDSDNTSDWKIYDYPTKGLSNSADMITPIVNLVSPVNNSELKSDYVLFNYTASDNKAIQLNCSLYSDVDGTFELLESQITANGTGDNFWASGVENGNYKWNVKCKDDRNTGESETWNFRVNVPKAPLMNLISNITINETETAAITVNASDSNPEDVLSYSINDTRFIPTGNIFTWQTGYGDSGTYYFNVSVSDGSLTASQIIKIIVANKNRAPEFKGIIPDENFGEDKNSTVNLTSYFSDPDGDNLIYKASGNSNVNITILNGIATLIPKKDWFGVENIIFTANDSKLSVNSNNVIVNISNVNDAPILKPIANVSVEETQEVKIIANASDVDSAILYYSINDSRFTQNSNIFTWQTGYGDEGVYYALMSVTDGLETSSQEVKVTILNKNEPPYINTLENLTISEDSGASYLSLNASDNDGTIDRFETSYKDASKVDCIVSDSSLAVTPAKDFYGQATCKIKVYDNLNAYDETTLNIQVLNVNDAPAITSYLPGFNPIIAEDGKQDFSISWKDIDNPSSDVKVEWFVNGNDTGIIGVSYSYTASGDNAEIKARVSDLKNYTEHFWNLETSKIPIANSYDGETTQFSGMNDSELANTNLILEKTGKGNIELIDKVDLRDVVDLDHYSDIQTGLAALDTAYFKTLAGKIAKITLYGLGFDKLPVIYYNSGFTLNKNEIASVCDKCTNVSYANGTLTFYSSFSSFKIGNTLSCSEQFGNVCSSGEVCSGNWLNAVEDSCCSGICSPKFSDIDRCENLSSDIEVEIKSPDEGDKFSIDEKIPLEIKVRNNAEDDLDFDAEIYLYDLTKDEQVDDYEESLDVESGKSETLELDLTVPSGIDENNDFAVYVKVDEGDYCNENFVRIDFKREKHDLKFSSVDIPDSVNCDSDIEAMIGVENIGKEDENVEIIVSSAALGISDRAGFNLDKYDGEKNSRKINLILHIPDYTEEKNYAFDISARFSGETEIVKKEVYVSCNKKQQETIQDTGLIRLNGQVAKQEAGKTSLFDSFNDRVNRMDMTDLLVIVVDIFLALGIIFIILYLILRR